MGWSHIKVSTILPEDEGTIGWESRATGPTTATLAAITGDGLPINDDDQDTAALGVRNTAPYFHDNSAKSLRDVLEQL